MYTLSYNSNDSINPDKIYNRENNTNVVDVPNFAHSSHKKC